MLKDILNLQNKPVDATVKAHAALKRGMGVTKGANGVTAFISDGKTENMFLVDAENIAGGEAAALINRPETKYEDIASGEYVKLVKYFPGEKFATDQVSAALEEGKYVAIGTNGKFAPSASNAVTKLICRGTVYVGTVKLYKIEILG